MDRNRIRRVQGVAAALATLLLVGACAAGAATPRDLAPSGSGAGAGTSASATPTLGATDTPTATPTAIASLATDSPTPSAAPSAAPSDSASPSAGASPTSAAAACTGTATNKAFFVDVASKVTFDVYCAVLPSGWYLQGGSYYHRPAGTEIDVVYKGPGGAILQFMQGANCTTSVAACSVHVAILGTTPFGPLTGELDLASATPDYVIFVNPGTNHGYTMLGTGMTQPAFIAFCAAMTKVAKA